MSFLRIKILITFAFCYFLQNVKLTNYISFKMVIVDDCVRQVKISNNISSKIVMNFSAQNDYCDTSFKIKGPCQDNNWTLYTKEDYLIKDYEYDFMNEVAITFEDWNHMNGYMGIEVYFNEFLINYTDQTFWECKDCDFDGNYKFGTQTAYKVEGGKEEEVFMFHNPGGPNECGPVYYTFVFRINDINELYKGGKRGPFKIASDYYSFPSQEIKRTFIKEVNYTEGDVELELINFILQDIISAKKNDSLITLKILLRG